ncbi:MAG TPA: transaldolase [Bryobacteraceae bacterium]|jgi:transaldolase/transaldolase/glucose-6-phosphate isomerase|nr:transaldolase [Bryobacteraceae bacterium]
MPVQGTSGNHLRDLRAQGQSIWLDYIRRALIAGGGLKRLIDDYGVAGVTSNPSIFEKAIDDSTDYDEALNSLLRCDAQFAPQDAYDKLAIEDVRMAADVLRPTYEASGGSDGFVSIEPPPQLTRDTARTVAEAWRLWKEVNRPNLMIKVVATKEGVSAVQQLISEGINVIITLMFSQRHYEAVAQAYLRGLEHARDPARIASVASFFVSRIDTAVDRALEANGSPEALSLRGKIAIANAKIAYRRFREIFDGDAFRHLRNRGARVQRVLWASTGTKNPEYRDVLYIEELIGPETVNTMPPDTLDAFRQHGNVRGATVLEGVSEAEKQLRSLATFGIDLDEIAEKLQRDGVAAFANAYDRVTAALDKKSKAIAIAVPK